MNRLTIIGNLTRDPEQRTTPSGATVCSFTVAVNRRGRRDAQNNQPEADFFRVSAWNQLGETCARYLAKGRKIAVEGSLQTRSYDAQDGSKRYVTEVIADNVEFCDSRPEGGRPRTDNPPPAEPPAGYGSGSNGFVEVDDDELPF